MARLPELDQLALVPRGIGLIGGGSLLLFGVWAMAAPESFFDTLATFDPYNQHLIQDIGAFQIGLGAVLLLASVPRGRVDALAVTLVGAGIGMVAHVVSHIVGHDLGGTPAVDIPVFAILGGLLLAGGWVRWRLGDGRGADPGDGQPQKPSWASTSPQTSPSP